MKLIFFFCVGVKIGNLRVLILEVSHKLNETESCRLGLLKLNHGLFQPTQTFMGLMNDVFSYGYAKGCGLMVN